jgi:hypothetical protein
MATRLALVSSSAASVRYALRMRASPPWGPAILPVHRRGAATPDRSQQSQRNNDAYLKHFVPPRGEKSGLKAILLT